MVGEFKNASDIGRMRNTNITYSIEKLAHFGGEVTSPLMVQHPFKNLEVLRYAEPVKTKLNPLHVRVMGEHEQEAVEKEMGELVYETSITYAHEWETGDIVIADNYSLLHGRNPLTDLSARHIRRIHAK
jgi:alpha-ketoglutarate-dependent taurine dioxygenase